MTLDISHVKPVQNFIVQDTPVTMQSIDEACRAFYCDSLMDVAYLILADQDYEPLLAQVEASAHYHVLADVTREAAQRAQKDAITTRRFLKRYLNTTTGTLMDVFTSSQLPSGTIIFGTYHDNSTAPTVSQEDVLSGKF